MLILTITTSLRCKLKVRSYGKYTPHNSSFLLISRLIQLKLGNFWRSHVDMSFRKYVCGLAIYFICLVDGFTKRWPPMAPLYTSPSQ